MATDRKVARAEPSRGAPSWSKMMAEMQTCGHTNAQHLYHDSGDIKIDLSACLVHTSIEHAGQTSGGTTADVAKAASAAPEPSRGAPHAASPGALRAARTIFRHMPPDDPKVIATAEEIDRESGHVMLLEALRAARLKLFYIGNLATNAHFDQANLEPVLKRIVAFANDGQAEAEAAIQQAERAE